MPFQKENGRNVLMPLDNYWKDISDQYISIMRTNHYLSIMLAMVALLVTILSSCSNTKYSAVPCPKFHGKRYQQSGEVHGSGIYREPIKNRSLYRYSSPVDYITHESRRYYRTDSLAYLESLTASLDNGYMPGISVSQVQRLPKQNPESKRQTILLPVKQSCDTIVLRSGGIIPARILDIDSETIRYRKCDDPGGPVLLQKSANVFVIKYPNGSRDYFSSFSEVDHPAQAPVKKTEGLGLAGFISSLVGLFVLGIPLGILSVVFGAISLGKMKRNPQKYKGRGFAIASVIIGMVDIIGAIIVLSTL